MTPCPCMNQPERCERCKAAVAIATRTMPERRKGVVLLVEPAVGTIPVRKTDGEGGEKVVHLPGNRKMRRAAMSKRQR